MACVCGITLPGRLSLPPWWVKHIVLIKRSPEGSWRGTKEVSLLFSENQNAPLACFFPDSSIISGHYLLFSTFAKGKDTGGGGGKEKRGTRGGKKGNSGEVEEEG